MPPELRLRPLEKADFPLLLGALRTADDVLAWAGPDVTWPLDEAQLEAHLALGDDPARCRNLVGEVDGEAVAHAQLLIRAAHRNGHVTRVLVAPAHRGRGVGTALMRAIAGLAFGELRLHRIGLHVYDGNAAAIASYERVGFVREGYQRDMALTSDGWWGSIPMALFADEVRLAGS